MTLKSLALGSYGANCYILCDDATGIGAVIDPGEYCDALLSEIKSAGVKNLGYILLTHGHFDHIMGVGELKKHFPEAVVAIGAGDESCLHDREDNLLADYDGEFNKMNADLLLHDLDIIDVGGIRLQVMETPGHTRGGVCFICKDEKIVFTGDTLFCRTVGRTDFKGGSLQKLLESVDKLMLLDDDFTVYPGHNRSTHIGDERLKNRFLRKR